MSISELVKSALDASIERLRQTSFVPFWRSSILISPSDEVRALYQTSHLASAILATIKKAAKKRRFDSFSLEILEGRPTHYQEQDYISIHARIKPGSEWHQVLHDAWQDSDSPNDWALSDNALRLLQWIQGSKYTDEFISEKRLGSQAGLRGTGSYSEIKTYLKEITLKAPFQVSYEQTNHWHGDYKIAIADKSAKHQKNDFNNPVFEGDLNSSDRESLLRFSKIIEDGILAAKPTEQKAFKLFCIHSRSKLTRHLTNIAEREEISPYEFEAFLGKVRLSRGLKIAASLEDEASKGWIVGAVLEEGWTWDRAKEAIKEQRNRKDPSVSYGLSDKSAKLLTWIHNLHDHEFELEMTPCIEPVAKEQIGINRLDHNQNSGVLLGLLVEEINEKTHHDYRLIPWASYSSKHHRILIRDKVNREADLVKKIQLWALSEDSYLTPKAIIEALKKLRDTEKKG